MSAMALCPSLVAACTVATDQDSSFKCWSNTESMPFEEGSSGSADELQITCLGMATAGMLR